MSLTTTISSYATLNIAPFRSSFGSCLYPPVRWRIAFSKRSGVRSKPSRSGSSPISTISFRTSSAILPEPSVSPTTLSSVSVILASLIDLPLMAYVVQPRWPLRQIQNCSYWYLRAGRARDARQEMSSGADRFRGIHFRSSARSRETHQLPRSNTCNRKVPRPRALQTDQAHLDLRSFPWLDPRALRPSLRECNYARVHGAC